MKININEKVYVKLTDRGISVLRSHEKHIQEFIGQFCPDYDYKRTPQKVGDYKGYTVFQLHELAHIFGFDMIPGSEPLFEGNNIILFPEEKFELSEKEFYKIIDSLDDTGGYLIKGSELKYWIEYYVNEYSKKELKSDRLQDELEEIKKKVGF